MKKSNKYILLIVVFIILIVSITITYLSIHYKEQGTGRIIKKYYDIVFVNATIKDNNDVSIKLDSENDNIHVEIPSLSNEVTFSIDAKNIGNEPVNIENYSITNRSSNENINDIEVDLSINQGEMIKGGETKRINVTVKYNGESEEIVNYNFNINYVFSKVKL